VKKTLVVATLLASSMAFAGVKVIGDRNGGKAKGCAGGGCGAVKVAEADIDLDAATTAFLSTGAANVADSGLSSQEQAALYSMIAELRAEGSAGSDREVLTQY
jgi:hypothetical protein